MKEQELYCIAPVVDYEEPYMVSGKGCYVYDNTGKQYLDISCGQFSAVLGHQNPYVQKAIENASKQLIHLSSGLISENFIKAAQKLHEIMPEMNGRIFLLSTGGEANEACLRYAKNMNNNKSGVISFVQGYHGLTHGTEGYSIARKWVKPELEYSFSVRAPECYGEGMFDYSEYIEEFRRIATQNKDVIAAALFEPIVSNGGMLFPAAEYWREIRKICDENDIYLIFDECQTGFGRTGSWFYYQQIGCVPDMLVCAKALGLGFPVSMVVFNGNKFDNSKFKMHHFSSHQNEPFSAELILSAISAIETEGLLNNINQMGEYLQKSMERMQKEFAIIRNPRGIGLMRGFDLDTYNMEKSELMQRAHLLTKLAQNRGLLLQITNNGTTVRVLPAYNITSSEIDEFIKLIAEAFHDLKEQGYKIGDNNGEF